MKWEIVLACLLIGFFSGCKDQTKELLQKEELSILSDAVEFETAEITSGSIDLELYVEYGFVGSLLLQDHDIIVFEYQINTLRKIYPFSNELEKWQSVLLDWNLKSSSLNIFIDKQLQTIRLSKPEKFSSVNKFVLKPQSLGNSASVKIRNIKCKGINDPLPKHLKIVTFGNSTTAYRNTIVGVYSQRLPELLLKKGIPNITYNEGIPGSHTGNLIDNNRHKVKHALDRLESSVLAKRPDVTVVCFGINDSWIDDGKDSPRIPLKVYEENLKSIVNSIQDIGSEVILMTPNALGKRHEKWRCDNLKKYVEIIRKLAIKNDITLIDQWQIYEEYALSGKDIDDFLLDGTHPNDTWHEKLAKKLANEVVLIAKQKRK